METSITVIFLRPIVISTLAGLYFVFASRAHWVSKTIVGVALSGAAIMQFLDWFVESANIHFLIPMMIQIILSIGVFFYASLHEPGMDGF